MMNTMFALRKLGPEPGLQLVEVPVPEPGDGEVLVEVEAASVCGTDLHIWRWDGWAQRRIAPPLTLGHEWAGTVVETGPGVRNVVVGDYVSAESHVTCGACFHCRTGHGHMCESTRILGVDRDGAFAPYVAVPESVIWQNDRDKLPPEIATLQEPFGNAVFATSEQDLAGRSVVVLGCGPVGLFTIAIAHASGAAVVLAADRTAFRLELAEADGRERGRRRGGRGRRSRAGSWSTTRASASTSSSRCRERGRAVADAFRIARNGGKVVLFGIPERPVEIDVAESLIFKNLTVQAVSGRKIFETWYRTRWLLESGVVNLKPLITHELPLERFDEAFEALDAGEACKIVLYPNGVPERERLESEAAAV